MTEQTMVYPPGSAIQFTSVEYSDFTCLACVITLKTTNLPELAARYAAQVRAQGEHLKIDGFPAFLITEGYAMAADVTTVHLGSYIGSKANLGSTPMTNADITALAERQEDDIVRTMGGETLHGMTVAGWRWKMSVPLPPNPETNWAWAYASHWSTPPVHEKAERLFTEADVRALLAERDGLRGALERIRDEYLLNHTSKWARKTAAKALSALAPKEPEQ